MWVSAARAPGRTWQKIEDLGSALLGLFLPCQCAVCATPDVTLCTQCRREILAEARVPHRVEAQALALPFVPGTDRILPTYTAGTYRGALASSILSFKKNGDRATLRTLTALLANLCHRAVLELGPGDSSGKPFNGATFLVPVPPSFVARLRRGFDPITSLLRFCESNKLAPEHMKSRPWVRYRFVAQMRMVLSSALALSPVAQALVTRLAGMLGWSISGGAQKALGACGRRAQLRGAMCLTRAARSALARDPTLTVILIDDVLTTGSTLQEAHRVLNSSGFRVAAAFVLAAAAAPHSREEQEE